MERRPEPAFDFNDPTLEALLAGIRSSGRPANVIVAMLFITPGKHAEPGGDVACIIDRALAAANGGGLEVATTPLLADDVNGSLDALCGLLARRVCEALPRLDGIPS